jgi:hypothetical protein
VLIVFNNHSLDKLPSSLHTLCIATCLLAFTFVLTTNPTVLHAEESLSGSDQDRNEMDQAAPASRQTPETTVTDKPDKLQNAEEQPEKCRDSATLQGEPSWYDSTHDVMSAAFCEPALWFDDFFASDRVLEEVGGTYVRWRNDFIFNEEDGFKFKTNLNFSFELPRISSKLKLVFEGDDDQDLRDTLPGGQAEDTTNQLGFRFDVKDTDRSSFNISLSGAPRIRARYRYTYPVREDFLVRFTQEIQNEEGVNGGRTRLDLEKAFHTYKLLRSTTDGFYAEDFAGIDWSQSFSLFHRRDQKSSISYEVSAVGITEPEAMVTSYRLGVRYRRNIHRDWLFLEITPDISWPIDLSEDRTEIIRERRSVLQLIFRLEIHFNTTKKRKYSDYIY